VDDGELQELVVQLNRKGRLDRLEELIALERKKPVGAPRKYRNDDADLIQAELLIAREGIGIREAVRRVTGEIGGSLRYRRLCKRYTDYPEIYKDFVWALLNDPQFKVGTSEDLPSFLAKPILEPDELMKQRP
jgi:hypothetical protein